MSIKISYVLFATLCIGVVTSMSFMNYGMPRGGRMPMRMPMKMNMAFLNAMMANSRRMMPMGRPTAPNMNFPPSMGAGLPSGLMGMMPPNFMGGNTALMGAMMGADIAPYGPDRTVGGVTIDGSDISYGP